MLLIFASTANLLEVVRETVSKRMTQDPILIFTTSEAEFDLDAEPRAPLQKRHPLKSGKVQTVDSIVLRKFTWPHELVHSTRGQPLIYKKLSTFPLHEQLPRYAQNCQAST